jgi:membrane-bound ClpP family serine protease
LDATGVIVFLFILFVLAAIVVFAFNDIIIAFVLQKIVEPLVRWIQRVFFGIDRVRTGDEALIGSRAIASQFEKSEGSGFIGSVMAEGERWSASSESPIKEGAAVSIVDRKNLLLVVRPLEDD